MGIPMSALEKDDEFWFAKSLSDQQRPGETLAVFFRNGDT